MQLTIAVLEGDGIGPEVTREAVRVLRAVASIDNHTFRFVHRPIGGVAIKQTGSPLPTATLDACLAADASGSVPNASLAQDCDMKSSSPSRGV